MAHGTTQAILGLGDGSVIGTGGNVADADNTLDALVTAEVLADEISIIDAGAYTAQTTVEAALQELYSYKPLWSTLTADSADIQNDTFTDSGLSITFPIAGTYQLDALLYYTTAAAADIQFKFVKGTVATTDTLGTSEMVYVNAPSGDATAARVPTQFSTSWITASALATTGAPADATPAVLTGKVVVTTAGTLKIQFAQVTTNATNTHVGAGSWLVARRVA